MALVNREKISLYEEAKAGLSSLLEQTAKVGAGLGIMLLLTGGNPPAYVVGLSFFLGIGFVAWSEKKRLTESAKEIEKYSGKIVNISIDSNEILNISIKIVAHKKSGYESKSVKNVQIQLDEMEETEEGSSVFEVIRKLIESSSKLPIWYSVKTRLNRNSGDNFIDRSRR